MSTVRRRDELANDARAVRIVHDIPGRLRLRLPPGASAAGLTDVTDRLNGVQKSIWSPRTRSLLIRYDTNVLSPAEIARSVAERADLDEPISNGDARGEGGRGSIAEAIVETFSGFNERVARQTRGRLDLPMVVSVALLFWAGRQLLRGPVTALSWTSALWYAHGLFRDYSARER